VQHVGKDSHHVFEAIANLAMASLEVVQTSYFRQIDAVALLC
jgi:hypothetical protein